MPLKDYWDTVRLYKGEMNTKLKYFIHNETEILPFRYSQGKWQSYNSDDKNLLTLMEYIRQAKPNTVLECGTFEARGTEYIARIMRMTNSHTDKTLVTIDVPKCILHMDEDAERVTFQEDEGWNEVVEIRNARLSLLKRDTFVKVIYREGLTQVLLPELMQEFNFDFIYEDASHLPNILIEDFKHINAFAKKGCVVCFDDMEKNSFVDWFKDQVKDWDIYYTNLERGQLWVEKIK